MEEVARGVRKLTTACPKGEKSINLVPTLLRSNNSTLVSTIIGRLLRIEVESFRSPVIEPMLRFEPLSDLSRTSSYLVVRQRSP